MKSVVPCRVGTIDGRPPLPFWVSERRRDFAIFDTGMRILSQLTMATTFLVAVLGTMVCPRR